jgi:hypothetical protein
MLLLPLTCLVLSGMVDTTPAPAAPVAPAAQHAAADAGPEPVLTVDMLTKMEAFWTAFMKEPSAVRTNGVKENQESVSAKNGTVDVVVPDVNIVAMAAKYPSVAADLKQAGLTAQQWESYRKEFYSAAFTWSALGSSEDARNAFPPSSTLGHNILVLMSSTKEYEALKVIIPSPLPAGVALQ